MNTPQCSNCSKFCSWSSDSGTLYGCNDPEAPEPLDPEYFCEKCARHELNQFTLKLIEMNHNSFTCIWWIKPAWYLKAIDEVNLRLVRENGREVLKLKDY